ncbi:hypothetical protein AVEN_205911-1 [Araneus ventricosus]|uniref:Uncharacterized protein n=1 Tax=Araneus ventricosus TaxID=182803 RepID=A0A4Y2P1L9_ARAVE|nr:hypothetical protein AVEN_205911-1 [Araneus ventricosus]
MALETRLWGRFLKLSHILHLGHSHRELGCKVSIKCFSLTHHHPTKYHSTSVRQIGKETFKVIQQYNTNSQSWLLGVPLLKLSPSGCHFLWNRTCLQSPFLQPISAYTDTRNTTAPFWRCRKSSFRFADIECCELIGNDPMRIDTELNAPPQVEKKKSKRRDDDGKQRREVILSTDHQCFISVPEQQQMLFDGQQQFIVEIRRSAIPAPLAYSRDVVGHDVGDDGTIISNCRVARNNWRPRTP